MTDLRDAARQALEALEAGADSWRLIGPAIGALKAALEQPYAEQAHRVEQETHGRMRIDPVTGNVSIGTPTEQAEPVAYVDHADGSVIWKRARLPGGSLLYTHPPRREWRSLSEEEIAKCWHDTPWNADLKTRVFAFSRAIEAALKEENHE